MRVWISTSLLLALLVVAIYVAYVSWNLTDVAMPLTGYVAMWLAIVFMIILGVGLVALMFYSHRHGYDEPPSKPPKGFKWD
jgi:dolichyl-phosphate-mannose--protein O-mannosyl transferase